MKNIRAKYKILTCKFKFDMWRLIINQTIRWLN